MPTRRDTLTGIAAFLTLTANTEAEETQPDLTQSKVFHLKDLPNHPTPNGGWSRPVLHGTLATGEFVELHETMLPAGQQPHPPHRHRNSEFILLREGTLHYLTESAPEPVAPGDVIFTASQRLHGLLNPGPTSALYYVVSVSHGQM